MRRLAVLASSVCAGFVGLSAASAQGLLPPEGLNPGFGGASSSYQGLELAPPPVIFEQPQTAGPYNSGHAVQQMPQGTFLQSPAPLPAQGPGYVIPSYPGGNGFPSEIVYPHGTVLPPMTAPGEFIPQQTGEPVFVTPLPNMGPSMSTWQTVRPKSAPPEKRSYPVTVDSSGNAKVPSRTPTAARVWRAMGRLR